LATISMPLSPLLLYFHNPYPPANLKGDLRHRRPRVPRGGKDRSRRLAHGSIQSLIISFCYILYCLDNNLFFQSNYSISLMCWESKGFEYLLYWRSNNITSTRQGVHAVEASRLENFRETRSTPTPLQWLVKAHTTII
jgi:hypothetical protein